MKNVEKNVKKKIKMSKKTFWKNQKKTEKIGKNWEKSKKKKSEIIRKVINNTCIYVYMTYWQYLIKVGRRKKEERRKKIEKYFKSSCLRELKILWTILWSKTEIQILNEL